MTEYAIVDNGSIVGFRNFDTLPELPGKPYRQFLPTEYVTPDYDSASETLTGAYTDDVQEDKVVRTQEVRNKTEDELAAASARSIVTTAAAFGLGVTAGEITGIEAAAGFGAGLYLDVGSYLLLLDQVQSDTNYWPKAYDDAASVRVIEKGLDYVLVEAKDVNGDAVDPETFNVELVRII